jgi:hypothetical protein
MFATEFPPVTIPSWVHEAALPKYPFVSISGYVLLGLGLLVLLIGYFTPIKKLPSLLAGLALLSYYPLAYAAHWFLFRFDEKERAAREPSKFEDFLFHHTRVLDWSILGLCAFFGLVFFVWTMWATVRKRRRLRAKASPGADNAFVAPPPRPQSATAKPAVGRPAAPQLPAARKVVKKPPAPPTSDNPFNFG